MVTFQLLMGSVLRDIRTSQRLRLADVGERAHVNLGWLSEIERGHGNASPEVFEAIFAALEVSPAVVFRAIADGYEGTMGPDGVTFSNAKECLICDL